MQNKIVMTLPRKTTKRNQPQIHRSVLNNRYYTITQAMQDLLKIESDYRNIKTDIADQNDYSYDTRCLTKPERTKLKKQSVALAIGLSSVE